MIGGTRCNQARRENMFSVNAESFEQRLQIAESAWFNKSLTLLALSMIFKAIALIYGDA